MRFDLIGLGGVGWVSRPRPAQKRRPELDSAIDGQGDAGDGGDAARRAAWIAGCRGVLKAINDAPKVELNPDDRSFGAGVYEFDAAPADNAPMVQWVEYFD